MTAMTRGLGLLAILAGATPCAPAGTPGPGHFPFSTAERGCAPWDGAATIITLTSQPPDSGSPVYPLVQMSIWQGPDALHGERIDLSDSAASRNGTAMYCESKSACLRLVSGWVGIGGVVGSGDMEGSYDFEFANQRHEAGRFRALWQARQVFCG